MQNNKVKKKEKNRRSHRYIMDEKSFMLSLKYDPDYLEKCRPTFEEEKEESEGTGKRYEQRKGIIK